MSLGHLAGIIVGGFVLVYVLALAAILVGLLGRAVAVLADLRETARTSGPTETMPTDEEWAQTLAQWAQE